MMVTFVSQCEKKALVRTRRVLDAFADRIGDNTWQTLITDDGLLAAKRLLRKTATKNTAVSCHWIRGRSRSELMWIVGTRSKFDAQGRVPVNTTRRPFIQSGLENDWAYLPLIKALVAVAALLHDWGKASSLFQKKLTEKNKKTLGDPLRHEWVSCLLLQALVAQSNNQPASESSNQSANSPGNQSSNESANKSGDQTTDSAWLNLLLTQSWNEQQLQRVLVQQLDSKKALTDLPPMAQLVAWLVVSHHRLPDLKRTDKYPQGEHREHAQRHRDSLACILKDLDKHWGYQNKFDEADYKKRLKQCFEFKHGLLSQSSQWSAQLKKWAGRLLQEQQNAQQVLADGTWRVLLQHARLCLMLGDHYYSSCEQDKTWKSSVDLFANTDQQHQLKQRLDEHLVKVSQHALQVSQSLSRFSNEMDYAYDLPALKQKSPRGFEWQDKAVAAIRQCYQLQPQAMQSGCFMVNMASTGCGKTVANAKVMRALSPDGDRLRYTLALGLRTLTLQTGDEYRHTLGMTDDELAVLIGSAAVKELHEQAQAKNRDEQADYYAEMGSESAEELLGNELDYADMPMPEFLAAIIPPQPTVIANKNKAFLFKPILACTIDHMMATTETTRGGRYILPSLRLLSADLVIDEVDDFQGKDLVAIARLVHLAGMLGRKVMISSATIPPALAEGFFNAYQHGWRLYCQFKRIKPQLMLGWVDEFNSRIELLDMPAVVAESDSSIRQYHTLHQRFVEKRVNHLLQQVVKRKAYIVDCAPLYATPFATAQQTAQQQGASQKKARQESIQQQYFQLIQQQAIQLHQQHHSVDGISGKRVSFGVVRMANIPPCVALAKFLLNANWPQHISPRVMAYHSRQVLLLRSVQEQHLDAVLKRKEKAGQQAAAFSHPDIRRHLDNTDASDVLFILVATPVEEVGRDHDFDWAVLEPSSYRSIVQLAGRVLRHRHTDKDISQPNMALMQYNLKALRKDGLQAYNRPGYEQGRFKLATHDLKRLLDEQAIAARISAVPRIMAGSSLLPDRQLADLEHAAIQYDLNRYADKGPESLEGWLQGCWWLTALPQRFNPFRQSAPDMLLYLLWQDDKAELHKKSEQNQQDFIAYEGRKNIQHLSLTALELQRLWLQRDYADSLRDTVCRKQSAEDIEKVGMDGMMQRYSRRYGGITVTERDMDTGLVYSDQFGLIPR